MIKRIVAFGVVMGLAPLSFAQKGRPGAAEADGTLKRDVCGGIEVKLDLASVRAAQAKLAGVQYSADDAEYDATKICRGVIHNLEQLCLLTRGPDEGAGAPPSPVVGKVKSARCVVIDGKDAPHQQAVEDGVWTVKYTLWSNTSLLWDAQRMKPHGPNSIMRQLGKTLGLKVPEESDDELYRGFSEMSQRCAGPKECGSGLVCGKDTQQGMHGPRCVKAGPATCSKSGDAFGHADKACPKGHWCTQYGICFPKSDFPVEGRKLGRGATCYLDRECASRACVGSGQDRFGTGKGSCR